MALSSREKPLFHETTFLMTPFLTQFVLSHASDNTTSQKYWGDRCMGPPPPQIFGGRPPSSPKSPFMQVVAISC